MRLSVTSDVGNGTILTTRVTGLMSVVINIEKSVRLAFTGISIQQGTLPLRQSIQISCFE